MVRVHRRLAYLLAWAVAASVTVGAAWLGIRSVLVAAAPTRTVPLSAVGLRKVAPLTPSPAPNAARPANPGSPGSATGAPQPAETWTKDGDTFNVTRYAPDSVMVSFFGNRQTSRVWVRWWDGPYAEVTESVN